MSDGHPLVRRQDASPAPVSLTEALTAGFYAWERRGRGWQVWPYPVALEPPFRPFYHAAPASAGAVLDDGRKPTLLSSLWDRLTGKAKPQVLTHAGWPEEDEEEPESYWPSSSLVEIQVSLPPPVQVDARRTQQLLLSLGRSLHPLSFEVVGRKESVQVQVACREEDRARVLQQLGAHFPDAALVEEPDFLEYLFTTGPRKKETLVIEFGLSHESMLPIRSVQDFRADPLTSVVGALEGLEEEEAGALQVLFQSVRHPWAESLLRAVSDWEGRPFFADAPETLALAREKVRTPLWVAVVRVAAVSPDPDRVWELVRGLGAALGQFARPASNELMPLSPEGLERSELEEDFLTRTTHRCGMLLSVEELASLAHLPSASVRSAKLVRERKKTKPAPESVAGHELVLGENVHAGSTATVTLGPAVRRRHLHVIGATGTGKSHLLLNLIIQDLAAGEGIAVFDPHGDLIEKVLGYVPEERAADVILFDPADEAYPVGFNVLRAHSALEKTLLASDLVSVFRRLATSWGDVMTAVLANAVLAFLESGDGGTLADLRRFLVDKAYRNGFLETVGDPEVRYFWEREFPALTGRPQTPILTRLNAFLRHPLLRRVVAQREGLDVARIMGEGKVLLAKLAQGQIGRENAHLLGTLLSSRFYQVALSRQEVEEEERRPFQLYIDEFHNFATPSMAAILAEARKYRLGLTLAHQDLEQLRSRNPELLAAVLTNPATRVCFRLGDLDARKLADGFASFDAADLQRLGVGEAVCRVERADWDFNLKTLPLPALADETATRQRERVIRTSRERYATPLAEVEAVLRQAAPAAEAAPASEPAREATPEAAQEEAAVPEAPSPPPVPDAAHRPARAPEAGPPPPEPTPPKRPGRGGPQHTYLQELITRWAQSRGWLAEVEKPVLDGLGSVDVALSREGTTVACEISVATSPEQELGNVQKCLAAGFGHVVVVSAERKRLTKAERHITERLPETQRQRVRFLSPEELFAFVEELAAAAATTEATVRGYTVKVRRKALGEEETKAKRRAIGKVILKAVKRLRDKDAE